MDSKIYERAIEYGFSAIPEHELTEKVRVEDEKRFREELKQITFLCPEGCSKPHNLNPADIDRLIKASLSKSLGKISFTTVCPSTEALLHMRMNFRTNGSAATPIFNIKKQNVKIEAKSLHKLIFETKDFGSLSVKQLNQIVSYHEKRKNPSSENMVSRALEELQIRELKAPKPQVEANPKKKRFGFLSKIF